MKDTNSKAEVNNPLPNARVQANEKQGFDMPLFAMPEIFRELTEQGVVRAKENCEKMKGASGEIADILRETYSTNAKGAADYGAKVIEISGVNTNSAFDFFINLVEARSLPEIMKLSAMQGRKSVEVASAQNTELWQLAQKVAAETAEPIKKSFTRALPNAS